MSIRTKLRAASFTCLCGVLLLAARAGATDVIAKFKGTADTPLHGKQVTMLQAQLVDTGRSFQLAIPFDEPKAKGDKPVPRKEFMDSIKKLTPGDLVTVGAEISKDLGPTLTSIEKYDAKPGEDSTNGYVYSKMFEKPTGKSTAVTVVATKFGKEYTFTVPMVRGENGAMDADPVIRASLQSLQEGNSVWIVSTGPSSNPKLSLIEPYSDPMTGTFKKMGEYEADGKKIPKAEVQSDDGKPVDLIVPMVTHGKMSSPDPTILAELRKLRKDTPVEYHAHADGDKLWLREIVKVDAPAAAPKDKPAPAAVKDKKKAAE